MFNDCGQRRKQKRLDLHLIEFYGMLILICSHGHVRLISNYNVKLRYKNGEFLHVNVKQRPMGREGPA